MLTKEGVFWNGFINSVSFRENSRN